ncbi:hypothetical protein [Flavobacterium sandaracinum]|uniref:Uncharacterized protein n=1 Tax=Flavobacterium sandaracinum TaxID=2541733 RepID=A0A4R5CPX3_9FLAO|nr:hypothetical protein [Flavobacterium sandaracinum]TDE01360.1 hypothetical protein E0F91_14630 [Flavobacterium sandaracinum]
MLFFSCTSYEKIGNFKYKVKTERVNTGDYEGMVETIKSFHDRNDGEFLVGYVIKSQKLHFETKKDTQYSNGKLKYDRLNRLIICTEIFKNGYELFQKTDSIQRIFKQENNGKIVLIEYSRFKNGAKLIE